MNGSWKNALDKEQCMLFHEDVVKELNKSVVK